MELKGAILIIGSLLWDPDQGNEKGARKTWRNKRLKMEDRVHVKVPIRYGRLSGSVHNRHFTMVFSMIKGSSLPLTLALKNYDMLAS